MEEQWKNLTIPNYEHFMISNLGRIKNTLTNHIIAVYFDNKRGYGRSKIKTNGITKTVYPHRLVAEAFLPDWNPELQVNHIDKNKSNNCASNLEMVTDSQNKKHSYDEYLQGHLNSQGKIVQVYDLQGNLLMEHLGLWDFCRKYGHDPRCVQRVIKGEQGSHHGLKFKYKEN